jgi:predicted ester cyclase
MSLSANKALVKSFIEEVFNKHNILMIDKYLYPNLGNSNEEFKQFLSIFFKAFPDIHTKIEYMVTEDNVVIVFLHMTGTQQGEFKGMPPTNKTVTIRSADLYRIEDEMIVDHYDVVDQLNLFQQIAVQLI